jgi:hypothetical protein
VRSEGLGPELNHEGEPGSNDVEIVRRSTVALQAHALSLPSIGTRIANFLIFIRRPGI